MEKEGERGDGGAGGQSFFLTPMRSPFAECGQKWNQGRSHPYKVKVHRAIVLADITKG